MTRSSILPVVDLEAPAHAKGIARLESLYATHRERDESGQVVLVRGPEGPWSGTLLNDFKRHVVSRREAWFEAACRDGAGRTYGPLRELLSQYISHLEILGLVDRDLKHRFVEVARFLGVSGNLGGPVDSLMLGGQVQVYEQLGKLLQECSRRSPAVLALRDIHLADSTTRAALRFVMENYVVDRLDNLVPAELSRGRFAGFWVVTSAADEPELTSLAAESDEANVAIVDLSGIETEAVRRFLQDPEVVRRFLASSAGSPENLRALVDDLPDRVDDLFGRRVFKLGPEARSLLEVLAVYMRPAAPELLARLSNLKGGRFTEVLRQLTDDRFVSQRVERGQFLVQLRTPQSQELIYRHIDEDLRAELHSRVGTLLEDQFSFGQNIDLEELAHHFLRSSDDERAIRYAMTVGERLHMTFAYQRASEYLAAILPRLTEAHGDARRDVLERLIDLYCSLHDYRRALRHCGLLKRETPVDARSPVYRRTGRALLEMGRYRLAERILGKALRHHRGHPRESLAIFSALAEARYGLGEQEEALEICARAAEIAAESGLGRSAAAVRELVALGNTEGKVRILRREYELALELFERNIERSKEHGWPDERVRAMFNCGIVALHRSDYRVAERVFAECLEFGHNTANPITRALCLLNIGVICHKTLRWNEALEHYLHALATFRSNSADSQFVASALNASELYLDIGDHERARATAEAAQHVLDQREIHHYRAWMCHLLGRAAVAEGSLARARGWFDEALEIAAAKKWSKRAEVHVDLARLCYRAGDDDGCAQQLELARLAGSSEETTAASVRLRGLIAWAEGKISDAIELFEDAIERLEARDQHQPLWEVRLELAMVLVASGQLTRARAEVAASREIATNLLAGLAESLRVQFTTKPSALRLFAVVEAIQNGQSPLDVGTPALVREAQRRLRAPGPRLSESRAPLLATTASGSTLSLVARQRYERIVGDDPSLMEVFARVERIASSNSPVLVLGESGTGKELLADAIHQRSDRRDKPFIKVNCGAFVETLLLSELFGHEKGAFTGAMSRKLGRFEQANGGTLFLDEIGDISLNTQVALLRVLQEGTFERVGGTQTIRTDVRVVCATNRNLEQLVKNGQFRLDLYYRLKGVVLELPALRQRLGDIVLLVEHFLAEVAGPNEAPKRFTRGALRMLLRYSWPGNIRELQNFIRSLALFVPSSIIHAADIDQFSDFFSDGELGESNARIEDVLDATMSRSLERALTAELGSGEPDNVIDLAAYEAAPAESAPPVVEPAKRAIDESNLDNTPSGIVSTILSGGVGLAEMKKRLELECIRRALTETDGNISAAAKILKMKRPRLSQIVNANPELQALRSQNAAGK